AAAGEHDQPISREEILAHGLVSEEIYEECERVALALYERGVALSRERGLILVDTKYELGLIGDEVVLMDEIHTPDSSRYWVASEYESRLSSGKAQRMLDKENIRQWLIEERGYRGEGPPPEIPDELRLDLSTIYLEAYRQITGSLMPLRPGPVEERIATNLRSAGYL
ncbi:MAG: phosphoribosylaminoimidazolesuccinocarboxamide synthase, partial [Myxococcota bacterium]